MRHVDRAEPGVMARKLMRILTVEGSKRVPGGHRHSSGASLLDFQV